MSQTPTKDEMVAWLEDWHATAMNLAEMAPRMAHDSRVAGRTLAADDWEREATRALRAVTMLDAILAVLRFPAPPVDATGVK